MADVANGWELSDSDDSEDIFQLTLEASNLEDEGQPGAAPAVVPASSKEGQPPPQQLSSQEGDRPSSQPKNGVANGKPSFQTRSNNRRMSDRPDSTRFRRADDKDRRRSARFETEEEGFDASRYSMSFPKSPPYCAWFGNVTLDTDGNDLEDELYGYFAEVDLEPKEIRFGNRGQNNNRTCCFVDFHNADDLRHALTQIDCEGAPRFYNYKLLVDIAEPRSSVSRFGGGRGKRRGRHSMSGPMSVGSDEYHSHVNNRGRRSRPQDSPPRGGRGDFHRRRGGRGSSNGHMDRRSHNRNGGGPRRLSRTSSSESSIHGDEEMSFDRRSDRDKDAFKVNGSIRDRYDGPPSIRSVRPSGPSRHRPRHEYEEARHSRANTRHERRANPRQNFNHTKRRPGGSGGRAPKSRGERGSKAPMSANPRFSKMFG